MSVRTNSWVSTSYEPNNQRGPHTCEEGRANSHKATAERNKKNYKDKEEKKEFFDCGGTGDSFFKPRGFEQFKKPEYINVIPIDQLVLNEKLKRPEFIKMDVQGSESAILNGGKLVFGHASYLLTELSFDDYFNKDNPLIGHTLEVISSYGFVPLHIFEVQRRGHSDRISDPIAQLNILFGKPS